MATLSELLEHLKRLTLDDLRDLQDRIALQKATEEDDRAGKRRANMKRRGIPGGIDNFLRTDAAAAAYDVYAALPVPTNIKEIKEKNAAPVPPDRQDAETVIAMLYSALEPKENRRRRRIKQRTKDGTKEQLLPAADRPAIARGTVHVKTIIRKRLNKDTDQVIKTSYRYVYIEFSRSAGDTQKVRRHIRSEYVPNSRELASVLDELADTNPDARRALLREILKAYHANTLTQRIPEFIAHYRGEE